MLNFVPDLNSAWMPLITFFVYISLNWWATWYPGAEPGGGGYIAQRMFCAKDEKNSLLATLWFNVAHYAIRPWPWILVALASLILFPGLEDPETGYIRVMIADLPPSLRGLMVAAFAAAYMSTIATQLNWGASYLVNDFYRRFLKPHDSARHYVNVSKVATIFLTIVSAVVTFYLDSIAGAWKMLLVTGAGTGSVLLLRWYWWRINAWSEVSAMVAAFIASITLQSALAHGFGRSAQFRMDHDYYGEHHDGGVAGGDVPHAGRAAGCAGGVLSAHAAVGGGMEADRGARARNKAGERSGWRTRSTGSRDWC